MWARTGRRRSAGGSCCWGKGYEQTSVLPKIDKEPKKRWYVVHTYSGHENKVKINLEELIDFVKQGKVDIEKIISDEFSWLDADKALEHYKNNLGKTLKVVLNFTK